MAPVSKEDLLLVWYDDVKKDVRTKHIIEGLNKEVYEELDGLWTIKVEMNRCTVRPS